MDGRIVLKLEPEKRRGYQPPAEQRVKRLLKQLLRAYGLRCIGIASDLEETTNETTYANSPKEGQET